MHSGSNKVIIAALLLLLLLLAFGPMLMQPRAPSKQEISEVERMAMSGSSVMQARLGMMYKAGSGVRKDKVEAYKWLVLAGRSGLGVNLEKKKLAKKMTKEELVQAIKRADEFRPSMGTPLSSSVRTSNPEAIPNLNQTSLSNSSGSATTLPVTGK